MAIVSSARLTGLEWSSPAPVRWRKAHAWEILSADLTTCECPTNVPPPRLFPIAEASHFVGVSPSHIWPNV